MISDAALERTVAAIAGMVDEARRMACGRSPRSARPACGSLRTATRSSPPSRRAPALHVEVISGEEEGRLAYVAARSGLGSNTGSLVVFDTGGGSSQFTFGHEAERRRALQRRRRRRALHRALRARRRRVARGAARSHGGDLGRPVTPRRTPDARRAGGMGGAVTNITAVMHRLATYDPAVVQGTVLDRAEIDRQIELYRSQDADARRRRSSACSPSGRKSSSPVPASSGRSWRSWARTSFTVSDRGLRHGVLAERFAT